LTDPGTHRAIGRPRSLGLSDAALNAAAEILVEEGFSHLTMERVAERASVSRSALYRRWSNKIDLAVDAISLFADTHIPLPDTGCLRDDVVGYLRGFVRTRRTHVETYTALSAVLEANPELGERCRNVILASFTASFRIIVDRAIECGQLPTDTDADLYADVAPALIRYRLQAGEGKLTESLIQRIAGQFFSSDPPKKVKRQKGRPSVTHAKR
jgi:AcrR family transcriptional regulator